MGSKATITVNRPREEVERLWASSEHRPESVQGVSFRRAPGDRGTEIHVELGQDGAAARVGDLAQTLRGRPPLAKVKDALRRFKQQTETGEIPRSDAVPEGELAERKLKQRPAQPLEEAGAR
jgi:uncharacterized membrane protein